MDYNSFDNTYGSLPFRDWESGSNLYDFVFAGRIAEACNDPCAVWTNEVREEMMIKWDDINAIKNRIGLTFGDLWNESDFVATC